MSPTTHFTLNTLPIFVADMAALAAHLGGSQHRISRSQ